MTASRRMWGSFILFGVTFFLFESGMTRDRTWSRGPAWTAGVASLLFFLSVWAGPPRGVFRRRTAVGLRVYAPVGS